MAIETRRETLYHSGWIRKWGNIERKHLIVSEWLQIDTKLVNSEKQRTNNYFRLERWNEMVVNGDGGWRRKSEPTESDHTKLKSTPSSLGIFFHPSTLSQSWDLHAHSANGAAKDSSCSFAYCFIDFCKSGAKRTKQLFEWEQKRRGAIAESEERVGRRGRGRRRGRERGSSREKLGKIEWSSEAMTKRRNDDAKQWHRDTECRTYGIQLWRCPFKWKHINYEMHSQSKNSNSFRLVWICLPVCVSICTRASVIFSHIIRFIHTFRMTD